MADEARLADLLLEWQDRHDQGQDVAAEQLCRDCPELLPELQRRLEALKEMERFAQSANASAPPAASDPYSTVIETPLDPGGSVLRPVLPNAPHVPGYEILGLLGKGGMGVVYQARQVGLGRLVALKMILHADHADAGDRERFRTEAEAVARLQHPNIVQIHEVGEHQGLPYFSLEFCAGGSLQHKLRGGPLAGREAAGLVQTLARAMHAAHQRGIIHRDLKPANVLLADDGTPKIADFGLAKKLDEAGQTHSGAVMGTPSYMSPEQAAGKSKTIGPATDVYALGAVLYDLLTGRPPFKAASSLDTILQVMSEEPVPPRRLQPKVPADLETICLKCLQKAPARRYASAEALAEDLGRFQSNEPIHARPVGPWERTVKWAVRKPVTAALVGVTCLAACALVAFSILYGVYQAQESHLYKQQLQKVSEQEEVRERCGKTLFRAQQHEAAGNWVAANTELEKAQEALDAQPELRADELRAAVPQRLAVVRGHLRDQERARQAGQRARDFQRPYDDTLFYHTQFTTLDAADSRARTSTAARMALAIYGLDRETAVGTPTLLERDRPCHGAAEYARLVEACYELLLIWAELEAATPLGQVDTETRQRAAKALVLLARAARLGQGHGLETRTYHLRRAHYLALGKGEAFNPAGIPARPTGALDWFLEALERYRSGQYEAAQRACAEILAKQENHFWARQLQALCDLRLRDWRAARAGLTACSNRRPDLVWPRLLRGFASSELGFQLASGKALDRLVSAEYRDAEEDLNYALQQSADPAVQYTGLVNRGALHIRRQRWAEAGADLRAAVQVNPGPFQAYANLGQALKGEGKLEEAVAALDQAIARAPQEAALYDTRAKMLLLRKRRAEAQADFEQIIAREPPGSRSDRLVNSLIELAKLLQHQQRYAEALAAYDRALALKPGFVLTHRFRAEALLALDRPTEAGEALDHYLAVTRPAPLEVYQARGLVFAGTGKLPAAVEMYTLALRESPRHTETRAYRAWTYLAADAVRLALEDFEVCLRDDPGSTDALTGRGNARIRLHDLDGALEDAAAAEKQGNLTDRLLFNLARLYAQAVGQLEVGRGTPRPGPDPATAQRLAICKARAFDCLIQALEKLPQERRTAFWRNQIQNDPGLATIRRGSLYAELAARYGGKGS